jgi:DNA repair exonuclease SbcCD ATPase subunit
LKQGYLYWVLKRSLTMTSWFRGYLKVVLASVLVLSVCLIGAGAQKKKKRSRRTTKPAAAKPVITNPQIAPPTASDTSGDVKIISTADQNNTETEQSTDSLHLQKSKSASPDQKEDMQQTITTLSNQVNRLTDKLTQMQEDDRYQLDMERLTRAEQRAEQIRSQLIDTQSKMADLDAKLEQIDYALKPENIDKAAQGMGTVHPEEARDSRKRQLENEKSRLQAQLKILETSKSRLEVSQANADAEVDNLRAKLQQKREQMDAAPTTAPTNDARPRKP